jgi:MarR-like DNA-binding transcriptional regulator SgrR of sgrS sRNA
VFPTLATIARRAFCVVRTVQRALAQLRDLGVLTWVRRIVRLADGRGRKAARAATMTRIEAERALRPRGIGPQLRLHLLKGRLRPG